MKRVFKVSIVFILVIIFDSIINLLMFSVLDKYNLFDNKIITFTTTLVSIILATIGMWAIKFFMKKVR